MSDFSFDGFEPANTTPVPDVLFDVLLPHLNEAQLKVLLYIVRRTLGFKKTSDAISLNQFRHGILTKDGKNLDEGCGLKNMTTISKALKQLEAMHCIESRKSTTAEGDAATTVYYIRFRSTTPNVSGTTPTVVPSAPNVVGVLRQTYDPTTPTVVGVLRQTYSQETVIQETDSQETVIQDSPLSSPLPLPPFREVPVRSRTEKSYARPANSLPPLTLSGAHILELYEKFKKHKQVVTVSLYHAANALGEVVDNDDLFLNVLAKIRDDEFLNKRGIRRDLEWIKNHYSATVDLVELDVRTHTHTPPSGTTPSPEQAEADRVRAATNNKESLAKFKAMIAREQQQGGTSGTQPDQSAFKRWR